MGQRGIANTVNIGTRRGGFSNAASLRSAQPQQMRQPQTMPPPPPVARHQQAQTSPRFTPPRPIPRQSGFRPSLTQQRNFPSPQQQQRHPQQQFNSNRAPPRAPPSVSFSELNLFANQRKMRPDDDDNSEDEYEYYDDSEEDDDRPLPFNNNQNPMQQAAQISGETQGDMKYGFMPQSQPSPGEGVEPGRFYQRKSGFSGAPPPQSPPQPGGSPGHGGGSPPPTGYSNNQYQDQQPYHPSGVETTAQTHERVRLIAKLNRKNSRNDAKKQIEFDERDDLITLRRLCSGASYESQAKMGVLMMRRVTTFVCRILEGISKRYPGYLNLTDWTEQIYLSLDQYDDMLYDIYDEYGSQVSTNPVVIFIFAIGTNALMFSMAKKIVDNPVAGKVMSNLAAALNKANNGGSGASSSSSSKAPPRGDGNSPAVPVSSTDAPSSSGMGGLGDIMGMFMGGSGGDMLGNLDMNQLLSGLGDLMGGSHSSTDMTGDFRGELVTDDQVQTGTPVVVNAMEGVSTDDSKEIMTMLRQQQDQLQTIHEQPEQPAAFKQGGVRIEELQTAQPPTQAATTEPVIKVNGDRSTLVFK